MKQVSIFIENKTGSLSTVCKVLAEGGFSSIFEGKRVYAFERELDGKVLISVCNMTGKSAKLPKSLQNYKNLVVSSYGESAEGEMSPFEFRLYSAED